MKTIRLLSLALLTLILFSCSSNDNNLSQNSIVGVWKPIKSVDICPDEQPTSRDYSICQQKYRVIFYENGNWEETEYEDYNGCTLDDIINATWSVSNGKLYYNGKTNI